MEEEEDISSPFWLQNSGANRRRLSRSYSLFLSSGTVIICLLVIALAFILVIVPTLHSFTTQIFKPNSVKKSWDSLNLLLVLFAIFCGFLSKNNNNESPRSYEGQNQTFSDTNTKQEYEKPNPEPETETPPRFWYDYSEYRTPYSRLRSFNSYPNLRQESLLVAGDERWRFSDDTHVNRYRGLDLSLKEEKEEEESIKNIEVNTSLKGKNKKQGSETHQLETIEKTKNNNAAERKNKKASATKDEKTYQSLKGKKKHKHKSVENLQSIMNSEPPKKKKHRHKSVENFQSILNSEPPPTTMPSSSFHDLFYSKKNKQKKLNSVSPSQHHVSSMIMSKTKDEDFSVITGNESPLNSIPPPPPPPPPFKMPAWKFKVQGDYVRIDSISSSSSVDIDEEVVELPTISGEEPGIDLLGYPNPNPGVDNKAGSFIESFKAGLRMEKMNSMKKQGIVRSNIYNTLHHQNH